MHDNRNSPGSLSQTLATAGAVAFLMLGMMVIGPRFFSVGSHETLTVKSMAIDAGCGVVGYILGLVIGRSIEG
jgi:hypothetical protein